LPPEQYIGHQWSLRLNFDYWIKNLLKTLPTCGAANLQLPRGCVGSHSIDGGVDIPYGMYLNRRVAVLVGASRSDAERNCSSVQSEGIGCLKFQGLELFLPVPAHVLTFGTREVCTPHVDGQMALMTSYFSPDSQRERRTPFAHRTANVRHQRHKAAQVPA